MTRRTIFPKALLAAAVVSMSAAPGFGHDRTYAVGGGGWRLERFGDSVAILRTTVVLRSPAPDRSGLLLLSCEGAERRMRLDLPDGLEDLLAGSRQARALLVARGGASGTPNPAVAIASLENAGRLAVSDTRAAPDNAVLRIVRLLRTRPPRLDLLLSSGTRPITPGRVTPHVLVLGFRGDEDVAFDDFLSACGSAEPRVRP